LIKLPIVFATKYRKKILQSGIDTDIKQIIFEVAQKMEFAIDTMESDQDHIHILVDIPPKLSAFHLVHPLKQITTFRIYKRHKSKVAYISEPKGVGVLRSSNKLIFAGK
jgi:putative transposase